MGKADCIEYDTLISDQLPFLIIDVREPEEYRSGHIDHAINIPLGSLAMRIDEIPSDRRLVTMNLLGGLSCHTSRESLSTT